MVSRDPRLQAPGNPTINAITAGLQRPQQRAPQQTTPQPDAFSGGLSDTDVLALMNGNMTPVLQSLLRAATEEFMTGGPQRGDYATEDDYLDARDSYDPADAMDNILKIGGALSEIQQMSSGKLTLDDGTIITSDMLNSADPVVAAQYRAAFENRARSLFNGYNDLMNQAGLDQWKVDLEGATFENDRRQAEFTNAVTKFRENTDWDTLNLARASDAINRELSGMAESRSRADLRTRAALEAAPYATGGKTEFTPRDIGALGIEAARMAGVLPDEVAVRYPGTQTIDPGAMLAEYDRQFGVGGGLPAVPQLTTSPGMLPALPAFQGAPPGGPPRLGAPIPYVPPALPPPPPLTPEEEERRRQEAITAQWIAMGGMF